MAGEAQRTVAHALTQRDLDFTPEDGNLYEVIDGALFVSPGPSFAHQHAVAHLMYVLQRRVLERELGTVLGSGLKVVLDEPTGVGPDVVFVATPHMAAMRPDGYYGAPDLLVEVVSTKPQLDRHVKFQKYASAGVPHYWIVDPDRRTLEAFVLRAGRYEIAADLHRGDAFEPDLFPGLRIDLRELWV